MDGPYPFERRCGSRAPRNGVAMAAFIDSHGAIALTRVEVVDASDGGLGLRCPVAVDTGARFSLYNGGGASIAPAHHTGHVAVCRRDGLTWRLGVVCDRRMAA